MVDPGTLATILIACGASAFMAWTIGAGSSGSTPFAPAVGANAISIMRAGFFVGLFGFAGAVLQGANVSEAVGRELILGATLSAEAAVVALLVAGTLVAIGVFTGYPIATAFTVTGAVVGVGLALGGNPAWGKYLEITTLWVLTPFIGGGLAYATASLLRRDRVADRILVPGLAGLVGMIIANIELVFLGDGGSGDTIAGVIEALIGAGPILGVDVIGILVTVALGLAFAGALLADMADDVERGERHFLLALGALVAFSAGGSQVGLAIGPLLPLLDPFEVPLWGILVGGGAGLLIGSWTGAPRMIKAISQDYSSLGPRRSIAALIPSFIIAQIAILYGIPVSFNEIIVSAVIGSGLAAGAGGVSRRKVGYTLLAWTGSLALSLCLGYLGLWAILEITG